MSTNRYRKCAKCGHTPAEDESVAFHRFPKPGSTNILRATAWATYYRPDLDWSSVESLSNLHKSCKVLCGRHFQDSCYIDSNKKRLSKFAVPGTTDNVIMQLNSLRSKIPSIVQQMVNSSTQDGTIQKSATNSTHQDTPLPGTSMQRDINVAKPPILLVNSSQDGVLEKSATNSNSNFFVGAFITTHK